MPLFKCSASKAKPKNGIAYIIDEKKAKIVSVRNLFEDEDYAKQFDETASRFGKGDKFDERKYYHCKLSCARKDNVSPEKAHAYAEELVTKLFKDYECVIATHTDTQTIHSHIIVNAVDPMTGKKLQFNKQEYVKMKDEANKIGKKYGFTETDFRKRGKNSRTAIEKKIMLKGGTSWKEELREVIAEAIKNSTTPGNFKEYLEKSYGVKIARDGKDYSYLHPDKQKPIRGEKLGTNYTKTEVIRKIDEQNNRRTSTAYNGGRRSGFVGQCTGGGFMRGGKTFNGRSTGIVVNASLNGIQREMQRLDFEAQCSGCGTDAASEERKMEQRRLREEAERKRGEANRRREKEQLQTNEGGGVLTQSDNGNSDGNRAPCKYSYGKGGGYKLTKAPEEYTLKSILTLTEGTLAPVACLKDGATPCLKASSCKTLPVWQGLNKAISDYLESVTLADLIDKPDNYSI